MLEKGKISNLQIEFMMIPTIIATGVLSIPSMAGKFARHDMWMTPLFGSLIGFLTVFIVWKLHQMFPKMTPIQYSEKILGKALGRVFSFFLVVFYIHNTGFIIRQYTDFVTANVMFETPSIVMSICIVVVSALAVYRGIEVVARSAVICSSIFICGAVCLLLLIPDVEITYMLPFLENGFLPVLKGSFIHSAWFSEFFLLAFLYPFASSQKKGLKTGMRGTFFIMLFLLYVNFFVLTILGVSCVNQFYPVYSIIRGIHVLGFFENFEVVITAFWVLGNFVKVSVFLYVGCLSLAQLFRLSDYRLIVFPISILLIFFSYWDIPNIVVLIDYMQKIQPFYFVIVQTIFPLFLLLIALVRKKRRKVG